MQPFEQKSKEKKLERFKEICRKKSIKLTPQRLLIYEELISAHDHPSTDMLYQRVMKTFSTISFDTVNRTLLTFHELGLAGLVEGTGNPKRFDGNISKHHHFQCIRCKKFFDIQNELYDAVQIPKDIREQFHVLRITVHIDGICDQCKQDN